MASTAPDRYEVEDGLRTLHRAHEISGNRKLVRHIRRHAKSQLKAVNRMAPAGGTTPIGPGPSALPGFS